MKSIVDEIVRQARTRCDHLTDLVNEREADLYVLRGQLLEAQYYLSNVEQAQEVMNNELAGKRDEFHEHSEQCGHADVPLHPETHLPAPGLSEAEARAAEIDLTMEKESI